MVNIFLLLPDGNAIINAGDTPADFKNLLNEVIGLCRKITQYQNVELCYDNENIEEFLNALKNILAADEYVYYMKNPDNQLRIILKNKSKNWRTKPNLLKNWLVLTCYGNLINLTSHRLITRL